MHCLAIRLQYLNICINSGTELFRCNEVMKIFTYKNLYLFLAGLALLMFLVPPHIHPSNYPADDAYFYLQVAANIFKGNGSTFNQITTTNGYHPLWMVACVAGFFISNGSRLGALHVIIAFQQILALAMIFLFYKISTAIKLRYWFLSIPILFLYFSTRLYCSEAYLNGFFVLLTLYVALKFIFAEKRPSVLSLVLIGFLGGLAVLARLDNIFVVGMIFLGAFGVTVSHKGNKPLTVSKFIYFGLSIGLAFLAVVLPYIALNYSTTGHIAPVSGAIKSTLPHLTFNLNGLSILGKICFLFAIISPFICLSSSCGKRKRFVVITLSAGVILHMLQIILTTHHHTGWPWYYVSGIINLSVILPIIAENIFDQRWIKRSAILSLVTKEAPLIFASLGVVILINAYALARYRNAAPTIELSSMISRLTQPSEKRWQEAVGDWLADSLPPNSRIMIYDWPGIIAYFSELKILAPDGLINDYQYNDDLREWGINKYLRKKRIVYWLGPTKPTAENNQAWYHITVLPDSQQIEIFAPLYKESVGSFTVSNSNRVARLRDTVKHQDMPDLSLWKICL